MSIDRLLEWSVDRFRDRVAIQTDSTSRTYGEVDRRANALANWLIAQGVSKGDRVGVLIGNQAEYPEAEMGIVKAGAVRVPMLISSSAAELERYISFAGTKVVFASAGKALDTLRSALRPLQRDELSPRIVAIGGAGRDEDDFESVITAAPDVRPRVEIDDDDLYAVRFTGGTTGLPKGVMMDHRCMTNVINNVLLNWKVGDDDTVCHIHPLSHASGKIMYTWWMRGARQVIMPAFGFDPEAFLRAVEQDRITTVFMIPTAINMVLDCPALGRHDTSSLRRIIYGGAPMPERRIVDAINAFGPVLYQIYGSSEAPNMLTCLSAEDHVFSGEPPGRLRSAGCPAYNVDLRIVDQAGADCPVGAVGEIISRGPHTMRGYWKDPALTAERKVDGWIHTGDMGRFDEEGYVYVVDRKDDVIITGGFNVWPAEVENALCSHPDVAEAIVFGIADDRWGEAVTAVVVPKLGRSIDASSVLRHTEALLPRHKLPKRIDIREQPLPKSSVGKLLRRAVASEYQAAHAPP
ncbi:MAG: AMP-binding protein [Mesorhizobium sp.]|nr:AMP-binding protein [Mesorhizobium sp.]MCO5164088.1 AMP-binding protein [Mesorhizobium sp.]